MAEPSASGAQSPATAREVPFCFRAAEGSAVAAEAGGPLVVRCLGVAGVDRPGAELRPAADGGTWDFSDALALEIAVSNRTDREERLFAVVSGDGAATPQCRAALPPREARTLVVPLCDAPFATDEPVALEGVQSGVLAAGEACGFARTSRIDIFCPQYGWPRPFEFAVLDVRAVPRAAPQQIVPAASFFPFVDRFGQFAHAEWPGKVHSEAELAAAHAEEDALLAANRDGPAADWDRFGGWAAGPRLAATGFFRAEKVGGAWWLVDPDGRLFFSLGVQSILEPNLPTATAGREAWFEEPPPSRADGAPEPLLNHTRANLVRRYGENWRAPFATNVHARCRAWGFNTLGGWTRLYVSSLRRTPYAATIDYSSKTVLPGWVPGGGRPVPDVFSPQFERDLREAARAWAAHVRDDPWCLGVFVDNEIAWLGCKTNVAEVAETYFSTVRRVLREELPNHLYLGPRIHFAQPDVYRAAARHCDVVSLNLYLSEPVSPMPPDAEDKPLLVSEFHFGAKDRGQFGGGLVQALSQGDRAKAFRRYVGACLDDPRFVGCHWYQYQDEETAGRFDGENWNVGFVTICDIPYPEMVDAARDVAAGLYARRSSVFPDGIDRIPGLFGQDLQDELDFREPRDSGNPVNLVNPVKNKSGRQSISRKQPQYKENEP